MNNSYKMDSFRKTAWRYNTTIDPYWILLFVIILVCGCLSNGLAQTFRVRAKPSNFGGVSDPATFFVSYSSTNVVQQPATALRRYVVLTLNEYPWQVTDTGIVFGDGYDSNGNHYFFRANQLDQNPQAREIRQGADGDEIHFYQMNNVGDIAGSYSYWSQPILWQHDGTDKYLASPGAISIPATQQQTSYNLNAYSNFHAEFSFGYGGGEALLLDDYGTVYGTGADGYYIMHISINNPTWGSLHLDVNNACNVSTSNGYMWSGGACFLIGQEQSLSGVLSPATSPRGYYWQYASYLDCGWNWGKYDGSTYLYPVNKQADGTPAGYYSLIPAPCSVNDGSGGYVITINSVLPTQIVTADKACGNHVVRSTKQVIDYNLFTLSSPGSATLDGKELPFPGVDLLNSDGCVVASGTLRFNDPSLPMVSVSPVTPTAMNARHVNGDRQSPQIVGTIYNRVNNTTSSTFLENTPVLVEESGSSGIYQTYDLNQLASVPSGWTISKATSINNNGIITAILTNQQYSDQSKGAILLPFEVSVDADNTTLENYPDLTMGDLGGAEKAAQHSDDEEKYSGVRVYTNLIDADNDGVPGYADGIEKFGNSHTGACWKFEPILINAASLKSFPNAKFKIKYSASDPDQMTCAGSGVDAVYTLPKDKVLRIWKKDGDVVRNPKSAHQDGDFINTDQEYTAEELGWHDGDAVIRLYLEVVQAKVDESFRVDIKFYPLGTDYPESIGTDWFKVRPYYISTENQGPDGE